MLNKIDVVYVIMDKLGGIVTMNANVIQHCNRELFAQRAVMLGVREDRDTRFGGEVGADSQTNYDYSIHENLHVSLKRLRRAIPDGPGVLVSNNSQELLMLCLYPVERTVIQIVHDEYNLGLAKQYEPVVDAFVAHSRYFYEKLRQAFPSRDENIFHLPYGIPIADPVERRPKGRLRLLFLGRMTEEKGIFDLPVIDQMLSDAGVDVEWTLVGNGPRRSDLQELWKSDRLRFVSPPTNAEVRALCEEADVFVFPTRFEGFPVALVEAMSTGLVPVVSDIPSGVPEIVSEETGFRVPIGDCAGFASGIIALERDRGRLAQMSQMCRRTIEDSHDIRDKVRGYESVFARYTELRREYTSGMIPRVGDRLDQRWLPNWVVKTLRRARSERPTA